MTKEKHHEAHPAKPKPKAKKEPAHEKPHAEEQQPYYEEPPEDHPPPPPLPTGQEPAPAQAGEPQAPAGSRLEEEQKAGHDAVAKAEQEAQHNKPPPHEEGT